jgi:hypothetical protein
MRALGAKEVAGEVNASEAQNATVEGGVLDEVLARVNQVGASHGVPPLARIDLVFAAVVAAVIVMEVFCCSARAWRCHADRARARRLEVRIIAEKPQDDDDAEEHEQEMRTQRLVAAPSESDDDIIARQR